jgi:hypothetical protein
MKKYCLVFDNESKKHVFLGKKWFVLAKALDKGALLWYTVV